MMKRILAVAAVVALLAGCDSKPDAPFGLKWGQSMESVSFIQDIHCEEGASKTACAFGNTAPFSEHSDLNGLDFNRDGLFKVQSIFIGGKRYLPDFDDFKIKLNKEVDYLKSVGFDNKKLTDVLDKCSEIDSCDDIEASSKTSYGNAEIEIWRDSHDGDHQLVVTFSK
ncbi:hypothetical protein [Providencia sp. PROV157]|uniref:hypothetical protein n=1 Tax=Providencia sp. PROV157 TaxID=2949867 RepID=UPI002349802B|nr:hypothetical protein [Providencia sp. PROV157]